MPERLSWIVEDHIAGMERPVHLVTYKQEEALKGYHYVVKYSFDHP